WCLLQHDERTCLFHAHLPVLTTITARQDTEPPAALPRELALDSRGAGIDPAVATFHLQSGIPEIAEMTLFFQNLVSVPRLERIPSLKEMARDAQKDEMPLGRLGYPVLQTSDILCVYASVFVFG